MSFVAAGSPLYAQSNADEVAQLEQRVATLERQVQEISKILEPLKDQLARESRQKALRGKFAERMAQDRAKYKVEQLHDAEALYQVANRKWGTPEAKDSLEKMIEKYPDMNRTGCAVLYLAQG
ncbi:MAG TPA: hypothetical protein VKA67_13160, partial [Verrucomicrobiae bacterium]|nr:hypothetical protein [Verrucomicrobiae bacterium]